ncbi:MBL fold metallo-hydrolase [Epidermidibacterium keratini]|uniref:MBL fold metallo-hydrolase n=1 Tax=Epidermidibacterium keratini TaxID=1891644 RepID=A0A7L4YMM8_9ACTN|nr:MBL fold metallo-hydrolase [Epidermidibacterium keratini]QHC00133.1 MBL fold metallo-hydrolase [Epidermidibacterium keratini]
MSHPLYEQPRTVTPYASVVLANNPGIMTLDGTNTWVLRAPGAPSAIVVDPGPGDREHLEQIVAAAGPISLVLLTHRHDDHSESRAEFSELVSAPVRSYDPEFCVGGEPLTDGEVIEDAGLRLRVQHTPGHTSDSICLVVDDETDPAVLTGDTILGRGTTVVAYPDGVLGDYLSSLRALTEYPSHAALPGHGPELDSTGAIAEMYLEHRDQRLQQVRDALGVLGDDASARQVVEHVYTDVPKENWDAAELSVQAQLLYLRG